VGVGPGTTAPVKSAYAVDFWFRDEFSGRFSATQRLQFSELLDKIRDDERLVVAKLVARCDFQCTHACNGVFANEHLGPPQLGEDSADQFERMVRGGLAGLFRQGRPQLDWGRSPR
jgi:hypothetical protein